MNRKFSFNKSMLFAGLLSAMTLGATSQVYAVQSPDVQKMQQQTVKLTGNYRRQCDRTRYNQRCDYRY